jgi:hypothetical protein
VRVLVDKHHADLFHALQLLFEDRFGWTLYTPIGHEWWDEGYWRFGEGYGDDRLAAQFLQPANLHVTNEGLGWDGHYPDRPILVVTLDQARAMTWDYVVATVDDNQRGFRRFADEVGAKYVLQVGNTGQYVDWSLDPLAIVSSEMPIKGRGVLVHQEIDQSIYRQYPLPMDRTVIRSFVNCFPTSGCWPPFLEGEMLLPDFTVTAHGIDGPDGNVETAEHIAQLMASAGWGWHDKQQGDGFGHVLHDWAAIGRPLIGHGAHYRGLMGEMFWDDLATCIDLDRHTMAEAMSLVRDITKDRTKHEDMAAEIRRRFETIDYEAEAESVRRLLA